MSCTILDPGDSSALQYIITHVFHPPHLPDPDCSASNDYYLVKAVATAACRYGERVDQANLPVWNSISRMLENLQAIIRLENVETESCITSQLSSMNAGDTLMFLIRAQNAGVILRKQEQVTVFESFELSPQARDVMAAEGRLICSYPGPAIEIPNTVFDDSDFHPELANFLAHMNRDYLDAPVILNQMSVEKSLDFKDSVHPCCITELLTGIMRSIGRPADVDRICKRVGDDVLWNNNTKTSWRRSAVWLLIRVALQTTLHQSPLGRDSYKEFMLFFMCYLAQENGAADLPSDLLQFISAKISRRFRKLDSSTSDWVAQTVLQTCTSLQSTIEIRWRQVQATQCLSSPWTPSELSLTQDIQLSLPNSGDFLAKRLADRSISPRDFSFDPKYYPRGALDDFLSRDGVFFEDAYRIEPHVALYDVELAVEQGIDNWVSRVTSNLNGEACEKLEILIDRYSSNASRTYANNPELLSIMFLTMIELWIAIDKIVIKDIPMLADYSPEIPIELLEHLSLCKHGSLQRLRNAHEYLSRRHSQSRDQWSVFSTTTTTSSFAVRFFRRSPRLRRLKTEIEKEARRQVQEKAIELREMNARYTELRKRKEEIDRAGSDASMWIRIYEWPLPANQLEAEIVLFELDCPVSFNMWRTATLHLLAGLWSSSDQQDIPKTQLNDYHALKPYLSMHPRSRISLGSYSRTSLSNPSILIPAKQEHVCTENGMKFFSFDMRTGVPVSQMRVCNDKWGDYCTYRLQDGSYQNLQKYLGSTSHSSNEVIANQADCHNDLAIHEYMAFGHLRSGGLLQWLNILRELRSRSLRFHRPEVHMLLAQSVSQVGPLTNTWVWHQELQQPAFCHALLAELDCLICDAEVSWEQRVTMDTVAFIIRRMLASNLNPAVSSEALNLLRTLRGKAFSCVQELLAELAKTPGDERLRAVLRDTAAICRSTFDVNPTLIIDSFHSADDMEVLLSCAMILHTHILSDASHLPIYSQLLLERDRRLSLMLESVVRVALQSEENDEGINLAVSRIWPQYHSGSKWSPIESSKSRWVSCKTAPSEYKCSQEVYFNILDGSLLIDGKPLGTWLPAGYVSHPLYKLIFGDQILEVLPSNLPGMDYCVKELIFDHHVYFSFRNQDADLVIRAKRRRTSTSTSDRGIMELIPYEILKRDLPAVLIDGHAHWLNVSTSVLEIRPLCNLWEASHTEWRLKCTPGNYRMWKGDEYLIDIRSRSWTMISNLLKPICSSQDLVVTASPVSQYSPSLRLSVHLPRHDLTFYVDEDGDLRSRDMRDMVYDENQSIGTFLGLVNQLVLRPKDRNVNDLEIIPRCVLIPDGIVSFRTQGSHVRVKISTPRTVTKRITYQTYQVDAELGCLTGNATLTSKLYSAYLHALTSGCSTDPLTGRTGMEEALSVLRSAGCSNERLSSRDVELLCLIASMCPSWSWYYKQSLQQVEWRDLPVTSQNYELYLLCKEIKERHEKVMLFHENPLSFQDFPLQDDYLLQRNARRDTYQDSLGMFGPPIVDDKYSARDLVNIRLGEHRAYTAATQVYHRTTTGARDIWRMVASWTENLSGPSESSSIVSLQYSRSWLTPDLPSVWLRIYDLLRESDEKKWFRLLFTLPSMVYASSDLSELVPVFIAFALHPQFRLEDPPPYDSYSALARYHPSSSALRRYIVNSAYPLSLSPERFLERAKYSETAVDLERRRLRTYAIRRRSDADAIVEVLLSAWPCETPPPYSLDPDLYDVDSLASKVQRHFSTRFRNFKLKEHLNRVQRILKDQYSQAPIPDSIPYTFHHSQHLSSRTPWLLTLSQLFFRPPLRLQAHEQMSQPVPVLENTAPLQVPKLTELRQLIVQLKANTTNPFRRRYVYSLHTSAGYFSHEVSPEDYRENMEPPTIESLVDYYARSRARYIDALCRLQEHLGPKTQSEQAMKLSGQWPCLTAYVLFRCLASNSQVSLPDEWKKCLIKFTLLALELQRARRLVILRYENRAGALFRELRNKGCEGWDAVAHPDWLLIQLQGNFLIRHVQAEVANEMLSPHSGGNTAMQLNMGEGKTSVIVPIAAVALANGEQLVRVVVPKPLTSQTLHLLSDRLGGLTCRRIYYLPISRSTQLDDRKAAALCEIMLDCTQERGVLVVQPDHVLSLKLVSVEKQLGQEDCLLARLLMKIQKWLYYYSRDIFDESDEILDVRSQLVFTIGNQEHLEGSPERWTTVEQVLNLVSKHASSLFKLFPLGVEYEPGPPGAFPHFRILQTNVGEMLVSMIVHDVMEGLLPNLSFAHLHFHSGLEGAIESFISCEDVSSASARVVKDFYERTSSWSGLLLLRGLLAKGILSFAFRERRWRVNYGLFPERTLLAVPYRAKDVPAQRAEFGHPDITIILTYLSYYYSGLTEHQLRLCFEILSKQHDPSMEYDSWVQTCEEVPQPLRKLSGVNTESWEQWNGSLFPLFSQSRAAINFYISNVVFPREAKQFPSKLSSSGWDLAEKKKLPMTGFSGTNDGQYQLPLSIAQSDPEHQQGTNARVLSYLLQPENRHYMCVTRKNGKRQSTHDFLKILVSQSPEIRVLLDVGAQMLELQNVELAQAWLDISPRASAAIYFDESDELMVYTRDGRVLPLRSSPFSQQIDRCVAYLDDAHTRGTDIRFPSGFRAAVTLGPKVTKDRLVQGCMRMRMLGRGHSIMFFAPLEVDQRIRAVAGKDEYDSAAIDTVDILHWAIRETWESIERWASQWVQQGIDHASRYAAWTRFCDLQMTPRELSQTWLQPEAKTLSDLYEPHRSPNISSGMTRETIQPPANLNVSSLWSVGLDEEQERELIYEVRREEPVERPASVPPAKHSIQQDVIEFVRTGIIPGNSFFRARSKAFSPAFESLHTTSAATSEAYIWTQSVLVTRDFEETVEIEGKKDDYLRPVHWLVSAKRGTGRVLVVLSPFEASYLLPNIRSSKKVHLHLYAPRTTKFVESCDDLALYSIPVTPNDWTPPSPPLMDQLGMFAGQLYLKDYDSYIRLCRFLGVYAEDLKGQKGIVIEPDGFILPRNRNPKPEDPSATEIAHSFASSPLVPLRALLSLRNKGIDFTSTHMGKIVHGRMLSKHDFHT